MSAVTLARRRGLQGGFRDRRPHECADARCAVPRMPRSDYRRIPRWRPAGVARSSCPSRCGSSGSSASVPPYAASTAARSGSCRGACDHRRGRAIRDHRRYRGSVRGSPATAPRPRRRRDPRAGNPDIDKAPIGEAAMGQECIEVHGRGSLAHRPGIMYPTNSIPFWGSVIGEKLCARSVAEGQSCVKGNR
jgi:hypothetical protein